MPLDAHGVSVPNRDIAQTLVNKYCPRYHLTFTMLGQGEILRETKGLTDNQKRAIVLDSRLIDNASPTAAQIYTIHEIGHALTGYAHNAPWDNTVRQILMAEGLGQFANPKYYRRTTPAALWKLHMQYEVKKSRLQWLRF